MIRYLWFTVAVGCLLLTHSTAWAETISEIVKRVKPAVVEIVALNRKASPMKFGTGFFISSDGQQQGREGLKQVIAALRTAFPDIHWVTEEMVGEGDKVFSLYVAWNSSRRILRRSCHGQADNREGYGCRSRSGR
jgi:SnoaL-like polyketide cyclase